MVTFACVLYGLLLTGKRADLHVTLLIGLVLGGGLAALASFMERLLEPSEFDILLARQIASISNADTSKLGIAIPLVVACSVAMFLFSGKLNVLALGRETAVNLGLHHQRFVIGVLILVSILISVSTALIGPMTFFGFLVAMLTYQLADTFDHKLLFPMAALLGFVIFGGAYFVLKHIFDAEGSVSIIIELVGGLAFLIFILRKGRLA
jgi:iron complex transport system permease protein